MEATVRATCPQCKAGLRIPAQWVGQAVKCKKCGAMVKTKAKDDDTPPPNGTAPATPVGASAPAQDQQPQTNAFDFDAQSEDGGDDFLPWLPTPAAPVPAPAAPAPAPGPQLDANGYPVPPAQGGYPYPAPPGYPAPPAGGYPMPPGYPYGPPPGYPYPMPPGYGPPPGYPAPAPGAAPGYPPAGYPYPMPPGYPPPAQHGYGAPPGYGYPQAPAPAPAPVQAPPVPAPAQAPAQGQQQAAAPMAPSPLAPNKPGARPGAHAPNGKPPAPGAKQPVNPLDAPGMGKGKGAKPPSANVPPAPPSNEFKMDPAATGAAAPTTGRRGYRRGNNKSKYIWIGVCLVLTAGLVAGGAIAIKNLSKNENKEQTKGPDGTQPGTDGKGPDGKGPDAKGPDKPKGAAGFPRRLLFISVTKYMYLNPLTQAQPGAPDRTKPAALRLAYDWRVPTDPFNNQVFVLSDTLTGPEERLPMKNVIQGTYQEFFKTSRKQDRIVVYFGGHAIEKDGKAYIAPMEAELDGEDWEKSVIPVEQFYAEMQKCNAAQKIIIWDVCRFNPEKGRVRPGSEPMSEGLHKALTAAPAGIQAVTTCKAGENAIEYTALRPDGFGGPTYSGSCFLESMKFVAEPRNNRMPKTTPTAADPLPIGDWTNAIAKRSVEMADMAEKSGLTGKQTVALAGAAPASLAPPLPEEKVAVRFEFPHPPKGASQAEIKSVEREFNLPPLKPGLGELTLGDFPFPSDVMKPYEADGVPLDEILKNKDKYRFRAAVLDALNRVREKWTTGAGATKIRNNVAGPINDKLKNEIKKEQEFWAVGIIELELNLQSLETVAPMREAETKRWQAHYDFALASVKARLAYMNEYNKVLGNLITETLPTLDAKIGQDVYVLVASETMKSGKDVKKMAEDAAALFLDITMKYKGTPWAIQAKQEKSVVIGLNWKAASLKE